MKCKVDNDYYKINIDKKALLSLREEIIEDCSERSNFNVEDVMIVPKKITTNTELKNRVVTESKVIGKFNVTADFYRYPFLIEIIDGLLEGTVSVHDFKFLYNPNNSLEIFTVKDKLKNIEELYDYLMETDGSVGAKEILLEKIYNLLCIEDLNENQVNPLEYYECVRDCINYIKTDSKTNIKYDLSNAKNIKRYIKR